MPRGIAFKLIGQTFGRLTVTGIECSTKNEGKAWNCTCDCGEQTILTTHDLIRRHMTDCGCTKRARIKARKDQLMREAGFDINASVPLWLARKISKI